MAEVTAFRNNALPYPVYGVPWTVEFPVLDADGDPLSGVTCDSEVSKNGDTGVDCTNEGTEIAFTTAGNKSLYYLTLTAAEMTADIVGVTVGVDSGKVTPIVLYPRKLVTLATGTSQGGAAGYITLAASTVDFDGQFNGCLCVATIDTNVEARILQACTTADQQCTVTPSWNVTPDADDTYIVYLPEGMQIPQANVKALSDDATAADNLELQYDTTGLAGDTFPATQAQLSNIANVGAAIHTTAASYTLTTGTQSSGTYASTAALDGTNHEHTSAANVMDLYYEFAIGSGIPTSVTVTGYLNGNNDDLEVHAYDWVATGWVQIGTMAGKASSANEVNAYELTVNMVGTGANEGLVRVRFTDGAFTLSSATLAIDQILLSFSKGAEGYDNGSVWIDTTTSNTNTVVGIDGTARNPVSTIAAANTLAASTNLNRFEVAPGSSITFAASQDDQIFNGHDWTLALGSQSISGSYITGAKVSGISSGANPPSFTDCTINATTVPPCEMRRCGLANTITGSAAGNYHFNGCFSEVAGTGTPVFDFEDAAENKNVNFRHYSGGIEIANMGQAASTDTMSLEGFGQLVIASTCDPSSTPTIAMRGSFTITDNVAGGFVVGGGVISDEARFDVTQVTGGAYALDTDANGRIRIVDGTSAGELNTDSGAVLLSAAGLQDIALLQNTRPTWEVNKAGNDGNGGLSWDDAFLTIGAAVGAASAGDRINIGPGTYVEAVDSSALANLELVGAGLSTIISQTAANTLKIGNGTTVRDMKCVAAESPFSSPSTAKYGIDCGGKTDIRLINVSAFGDWDGLYAAAANRLWIENCHFSSYYDGANFSGADNVTSINSIYETDGAYSSIINARAINAEGAASNLVIRGGALISRRAASSVMAAVGLGCGTGGQHILEGVLIIAEQQNAGSSGAACGVADFDGTPNLATVVLSNCQIYTSQSGSGAEYHLTNNTGTILVDGSTMYDPAKTNGAITDRTLSPVLQRTTIAAYTSNTSFTLSGGSANDDAYNGALCVIQDQTTAAQKAVGIISDYTGATKTVTLAADPCAAFTFANGDIVTILAGNAALNFKVYVDSWHVE